MQDINRWNDDDDNMYEYSWLFYILQTIVTAFIIRILIILRDEEDFSFSDVQIEIQ